jgi:RepB DNA-primase from phage plasmid
MDTAKAIASPDFQRWLRDHNERGGEIYLTTNALSPQSSTRTRQDVLVIRHIYLDIDAEGPAVLQRVMTDPRVPKPNYVVSTSPGKFQTTWKVQDFSIGQAETLQRVMAVEFGGDRAVVDAARVLRVPGFTNHKYREPHLITAQRHSTEVHTPKRFRFPLPEFGSDASNLSRTATTKAGSSEAKPNKEISQSKRDWAYAK